MDDTLEKVLVWGVLVPTANLNSEKSLDWTFKFKVGILFWNDKKSLDLTFSDFRLSLVIFNRTLILILSCLEKCFLTQKNKKSPS